MNTCLDEKGEDEDNNQCGHKSKSEDAPICKTIDV